MITLIYFLAAIIPITSFADKWVLEPNEIKSFPFGRLECESHSNPTKASRYPSPFILCRKDQSIKFKIPLALGSYYEVSKDGNYLLSLSNSGLDDYAFWIVDQQGKFINYRKHMQ